jgi:orotidine-5'-phosphate decarboxylase
MNNPICLALDNPDLKATEELLAKVRTHISMIKLGPIMFFTHGKECLKLSKTFKIPVFLDLKLSDIPKTVTKTVEILSSALAEETANDVGYHYISLHTMGGYEMLEKAVDVLKTSNNRVCAITVMTSLDKSALNAMNFNRSTPSLKTLDLLNNLTDNKWISTAPPGTPSWQAYNQGYVKYDIKLPEMKYVVPPSSVKLIRNNKGTEQLPLLIPGIRKKQDEDHHNQLSAGKLFPLMQDTDMVVIGKPITDSEDPELEAIYYEELWKKSRAQREAKKLKG